MMHWGTPHSSSAALPVVRQAIAGRRRARVVRRALIAALVAIPLLLLLAVAAGAQETRPAPAGAAPDSSPGRPAIRSWTADRRDYVIGDIITVLIDERTAASATRGNVATDRKRREMDVGADLPSAASAATGSPSVSISSSNDGESTQRGEATRGTRFVGEMAVRVVAIGPEGNLQVRGEKLIDVDRNRQQMSLSGWIRPQDVSSRETVESARIAEAQIVYTQKGSLGKPRSGILTRVLGVFWP